MSTLRVDAAGVPPWVDATRVEWGHRARAELAGHHRSPCGQGGMLWSGAWEWMTEQSEDGVSGQTAGSGYDVTL